MTSEASMRERKADRRGAAPFLVVADERIRHRSDDLLRFDGLNESQQPGPQGFNRTHGVHKGSRRCGQFFHLGPINRHEEFLACRSVAIQGSGPTPAFFAMSFRGALAAQPVELRPSPFQDAFAISLCIRARLSPCNFRSFRRHPKILATEGCLR
jgi:hypothetical protein